MSEFSSNWEGGAKVELGAISETFHYKFVLLGGGNSAGYAARYFVDFTDKKLNPLNLDISNILSNNGNGNPSSKTFAIISAEDVPPYERPALSKAYLNPPGSKVQARLPSFNTCVGTGKENQGEAWYKSHNIDLLLGHEALDVDVEKQRIVCDRKADRKLICVTYDKLILATGARPLFTNMFEKADILKNIFVLRNEMDASAIIERLNELHNRESNPKVVIIGGGYIGMETAAAFAGWNVDVTMVFPEDNLMSRIFTTEISDWYERYLKEEKGVKILKKMKVMKFIGEDGEVASAELENGEQLQADMALIGIGAVLNTDLFKGQLQFAPKSVRGIAVDSCLRTSDPNVFAVGDIAAVPYKRSSKRFEHVDHCRKTAEIAMKNCLIDLHNYLADAKKEAHVSDLEKHDYTPFFYSRLFEYTDTPVVFNFYGSTGEEMEDIEVVQFGDTSSLLPTPIGAFWVDKTSRIIGGILCCAGKDAFEELKQIVLSRRRLTSLTAACAQKLYTKL